MKQLYPLKFEPIFQEKVWGGDNLRTLLDKNVSKNEKIGESLEISAIEDKVSIVSNGFLAGNSIQDIIEIYMTDLVGYQVYMKYGIEFPLLIKFIDANDKLSIQVHPDNDTAKYRHYAYGKTELWYVVAAKKDAQLIMGFKEQIDKTELYKKIQDNTFIDYLNFENVQKGDVFYIPPGRIHALLEGVVVAEIQQTSDITYRLYDWNRPGLDGKPRDLHIDLALDVIDYKVKKSYKEKYEILPEQRNLLNANPYFTVNLVEFDKETTFDYSKLDSFVVYMCLEGAFLIDYQAEETVDVVKGETVLIPAEFETIKLKTNIPSKILEIFIPFVYVDEDDNEQD